MGDVSATHPAHQLDRERVEALIHVGLRFLQQIQHCRLHAHTHGHFHNKAPNSTA
jgi:hypothetical protein